MDYDGSQANFIITVCNEVAARLYFHKRVSRILSTGGGRAGDGCLPQWMLGYTPPQQTPAQSKHLPPEHTPPPTATAADGMHPTGMLSCVCFIFCVCFSFAVSLIKTIINYCY